MPGTKCHFKDCLVNTFSKIPLHRFPRDNERSKKWVEASKNPGLKNISALRLNKSYHICSNHFQNWCFLNVDNKKRLVHNAVPNQDKPAVLCSYIVVRNETGDSIDYIERKKSVVSLGTPRKISTSANAAQKQITPPKLNKGIDYLKIVKKTRSQKKLKEIKSAIVSCGISKKLSSFILRQVRLIRKIPKGKRYFCYEKIFAYRLFCRSRTAYKVMQDLIQLPSKKALNRFTHSKLTKSGVSEESLISIKSYIDKIPLEENIFALIFDEMSLKPNLTYIGFNDEVVGFEDCGDKIMGKTQLIGSQALVLMLKSLRNKRKIPLGYFINKGSMTAKKLLEIIVSLLNRLDEVNVNVKAIICKLKSNNCSFYSELGVHAHKPFFVRNGKRILCFYDPSQLMMMTSKNLKKYDIISKDGTLSFTHIEKFYDFDKTQKRRIAPKINNKHINADNIKSMKVFLPAQLFSNTVAAGMGLCMKAGLLPLSAAATSEFVGKMNDLFDSLNGESLKPHIGKPYQQALWDSSPHFELWKDIIKNMVQWRFQLRQTSNPPPKKLRNTPVAFHLGWIQTLNAAKLLFNDLKKSDSNYLMTKKLNQDCLRSLFNRIKEMQEPRTHPTAYQLLCNFRICASNDWLDVSKSRDDCYFLENKFFSKEKTKAKNVPKTVKDYYDLPDFKEVNFADENKLVYLAGYVSRQLLSDLSCPDCLDNMTETGKSLTFFKRNGKKSLSCKYPSKSMFKCFEIFFHVSNILLADILYKSNILKCLRQSFMNVAPLNFLFQCLLHGEEQMLSIVRNCSIACLKVHLLELNYHLNNSNDLKDVRETLKKKSISALKNTNPHMLDLIYNIRFS